MMTHLSGAILMCEKASIEDPEIKDPCQSIIERQGEEISQIEAKLNELEQ